MGAGCSPEHQLYMKTVVAYCWSAREPQRGPSPVLAQALAVRSQSNDRISQVYIDAGAQRLDGFIGPRGRITLPSRQQAAMLTATCRAIKPRQSPNSQRLLIDVSLMPGHQGGETFKKARPVDVEFRLASLGAESRDGCSHQLPAGWLAEFSAAEPDPLAFSLRYAMMSLLVAASGTRTGILTPGITLRGLVSHRSRLSAVQLRSE